jgi:ribosomal protein S18 acetylase RimI-like enzyme
MEDEIKIVIRDAQTSDRNFILSSWLKGNYFGNFYFGQIPQHVYFEEYSKWILKALADENTKVSVACDENIPGWIVGFAVSNKENLYWVHVKKEFRNRGIATLLLAGKGITTVKATTKVGRMITEHKGLIFNPL